MPNMARCYLFNDPLEDTEMRSLRIGCGSHARYLFNDPLEDTEIGTVAGLSAHRGGYLFNDPLEDTEMLPRPLRGLVSRVTCSTIR